MLQSILILEGLEGEILYAAAFAFIPVIVALVLAFAALWLLGNRQVSSQRGDDPRQ